MAEAKVDAASASVARVGEGDVSVGLDEEKVLIALIDESKDQLPSESDSLLSPQRLHSKPSESKGYNEGPLLGMDKILFELGFSDTDLPVCLASDLEGTPFRPLGELMPKLNSISRSTAEIYDGELSGPLDFLNDGIITNGSIAYSGGGSLELNYKRLAETISESSESRQIQPRILDHKVYIGPPNERARLSKLENSSGIPDSNAQLHAFTGQEDEGESSHACRPNHKKFSSNDRNALELLSYELEGSDGIQLLSSNLAISEQSIIRAREEDCYHKHEQFNSMSDHPVANDLWPGAVVRSNSTNVPQHLMDNVNFTHFEPKFNRFGSEKYLLGQQFQKQYLQHLPSHEDLHAGIHSAEQGQGSAHPEISYQSIHNFEHLVELQIQEKYRQFLREQQQMQLKLHCNQKLQQQLHQQKQKKQQEQQSSFLQHFPHRQLFESSLAEPCVHPLHLLGNNSLDETMFQQKLMHLKQHPDHLYPHRDPLIEKLKQEKFGHDIHHDDKKDLFNFISHPKHTSLSMKEHIIRSLEQNQLQAQHLPLPSRQQQGMEDDVHGGGGWSVNESGQFSRAENIPYQHYSNRLNFTQHPSSLEQAKQRGRNLMLHERMQNGIYKTKTQSFALAVPLSTSPHGHHYPSVQERQLSHVSSTGQPHSSIPFSAPHFEAMDSHFTVSNGKVPYSWIETQTNLLHREINRHNMNMRISLPKQHPNAWSSTPVGSGSSNDVIDDHLRKLGTHFSNPSELINRHEGYGKGVELSYMKDGKRLTNHGFNAASANFYDHEIQVGKVYNEGMAISRLPSILDRSFDSSLLKPNADHFIASSPVAELVSASTSKGKNSAIFSSSEASASGDPFVSDPSSINITKSIMKPTTEPESKTSGIHNPSQPKVAAKKKKQGKKGRPIDPSLLGFRIHSNRVLLGEMLQPDH